MNGSWLQRVKLHQLRVIITVAETQNILRAAELLGRSQPAITKSIQELEHDIGITLFDRTGKGVFPTALGQQLIQYARQVFIQLERAHDQISAHCTGQLGTVHVGTLIAGSAELLPKAIAHLHKTHPQVHIQITESTYDRLIPLLHQGKIDFIVGRLPPNQYRDNLELLPFYEEQIAVACRPAHPALQKLPCQLADLLRWPWITPDKGTSLRQILDIALQQEQVSLSTIGLESVSVVLNRRLLLEADYLCAFPRRVILPDLEAGILQEITLHQPLSFGQVGVSYFNAAPLTPAAHALLSALKHIASTL